jgi:hypothetical protein
MDNSIIGFQVLLVKKPDLLAVMGLFESASWQAQPGEEGEMEERERGKCDPAILCF